MLSDWYFAPIPPAWLHSVPEQEDDLAQWRRDSPLAAAWPTLVNAMIAIQVLCRLRGEYASNLRPISWKSGVHKHALLIILRAGERTTTCGFEIGWR